MRRSTLLAFALSLASAEVVCAADSRLEKIVADWQKRQQRFDVVKYKVSGVMKVPKGAYTDLVVDISHTKKTGKINPPQDIEGSIGFTILLDFVNGRHRRDTLQRTFNYSTGGFASPLSMKDSFNGSVMKSYIPKTENADPRQQVGVTQPEMTIVSGNMKNGQFLSEYYPIFFGHGRIPTDREPILPGQLRNKPDSDNLYIYDTGVLDERKCLVVRTKPLQMSTGAAFNEYWVDPQHDSAVVRWFSYGGKLPGQEIKIQYQLTQGSWLPQSWSSTVFERGKTLYYQKMRVDSVAVNPPIADSDFEIGHIKPGMLVEERTDLPTSRPTEFAKSKLTVYRTREDGSREEIRDPARRPGDQFPLRHKPEYRPWFYVMLVISGFLLLLFWFGKRIYRFAKRGQ